MRSLKSTAISCIAGAAILISGFALLSSTASATGDRALAHTTPLNSLTSGVSDPYSYDAAGGAPTPLSSSAANATAITLAAAPALTGYTFSGWTDGAACDSLNAPEPGGLCVDGTARYQAGGSYTLYSDGSAVIFTAEWTVSSSSGGTTTTVPATTTTTLLLPTITTILESSPSTTYGAENAEEFSVAVTGQGTGGAPEGTVTVYSSTTELCTAPLTARSASSGTSSCWIRVAGLSAGSYTDVFATYTPATSSTFAPSTSSALSPGLLVGRDITITTVTESQEYVVQYRETAVVFTAHVSADYGVAIPAGGKVVIRVGSASCLTTTTNGNRLRCTINTHTLKPGKYNVVATYYGSTNLQPSMSRPGRLDVTGRPSHR
jgi:hypothetical protein